MATGGAPAHEKRREALSCSLCLEIFTSPKLLPCSHSFCVKCLQDLTTHLKSKTFPCPQCREQVTVPQGGVGSFQNNFYLNPQDLDKARDGTLCLTHSNQELDLYCEDCKLAVCLKCVLTKHKLHSTKDLSEAASEAKSELKLSQVRLRKAVSYMTDEVSAESKELKDVQDKKAALQAAVTNKRATLVAMVNKICDETLTSLDTVSGKIESQINKELDSKRNNIGELCQLQQQTQQAIDSGTSLKLLTVAKEMREGRGSPQAVTNLTPAKRRSGDPS
ncbi:tripartite motif-containing protein 3-like [Littorina saxatilis]|uniref:tripartite motif-containing protein 3-like n=1 Tax=Littorina saxatilis TaxID=31220 RepID=UPI0038B4C8DB